MSRRKLPLWKYILYLDFFAIYFKDAKPVVSGWAVLGLAVTSPIWIWWFAPSLLRMGWKHLLSRIENQRRRQYGGLNISERNTARRRLWRWRRKPLLPAHMLEHVRDEKMVGLLDLPYELREIIWRELVSPEEIWIKHDPTHARMYAVAKDTDGYIPTFTDYSGLGRLLRVNRQIYAETSGILYHANTFCFQTRTRTHTRNDRTSAHFVAFVHTILPERLQQIRSLYLAVDFSWYYDRKEGTYRQRAQDDLNWSLTCQILRSMQGLRTLRLAIDRCVYQDGCRSSPQRERLEGQTPENKVLLGLHGVRAQDFIVQMPWPEEVRGDVAGSFTLEYVDGLGAHRPIVAP